MYYTVFHAQLTIEDYGKKINDKNTEHIHGGMLACMYVIANCQQFISIEVLPNARVNDF